MLVGENQKFAAALIVPDFENLKMWCNENNIEFISKADIVKNPEVKKLYQSRVNEYNAFIGDTEKIKKFRLTKKEWTVETNEISATFKLRRSTLTTVYRNLIEEIYQ